MKHYFLLVIIMTGIIVSSCSNKNNSYSENFKIVEASHMNRHESPAITSDCILIPCETFDEAGKLFVFLQNRFHHPFTIRQMLEYFKIDSNDVDHEDANFIKKSPYVETDQYDYDEILKTSTYDTLEVVYQTSVQENIVIINISHISFSRTSDRTYDQARENFDRIKGRLTITLKYYSFFNDLGKKS